MTELPRVAVIVPCRNEAARIRQMVASLLDNEYPREKLEVVFVDGMSRDGTRELLQDAAASHRFIRVLDNPKMTAPAAMNAGIRATTGEIIVRMDAHNEYPRDYIVRCVRLLLETGAGCAGGVLDTVPNGEHPWARAVAAVTASLVGVGNSRFRTGGPRGFVDTVPNGTFPRAVLEEVGLYDERLTRNQDNELSARIRKRGYKVAFDPAIRVRYYNQPGLRGLARQGFYTGMWNVYTVFLHPHAWRPRHFVPAGFVLYLGLLAACAAERASWLAAAALPLALYAALLARLSAGARASGAPALRVAATALAYHFSYGFGTHLGVANLLTGRWRRQLGRPLQT